MSSKIDIRKDPFYQKGKVEGKIEGVAEGIEKGIEKGIEEQSHLFVISLLENTDFDDQKIALIARVSLEFVRKVKKEAGL
jgi:predicted transposase YdaD